MKFNIAICIIFSSAWLCMGCIERDKRGRPVDEPTAGSIKITADESLRPLVEAEVSAFHGIYRDAHIDVEYVSETEAIDALLKDSVRLAVVSRKLTVEEIEFLKLENIEPVHIGIATGAIALIVNRSNTDSLITKDQLKEILQGKLTQWKQIRAASTLGSIEVIFDNPASGMIRLLKDSIVGIDKLPANCFAVSNNQAVVDYVAQKPNAMGLIGVEWISDRDDSTVRGFLHTIRVMGVRQDSTFYKPYQAYIATRQYPLCRNILIINREARAGLCSGFAAFVASDKGQRIVLKAGLVPATMPVRIVEINRDEP
jgi:phosphate transport system substrate-binding protein